MALSHPWDQFDEAALFYRSVLGLRPHESVEVADPYGLLRSRAMSNATGTVRLALNIAHVERGTCRGSTSRWPTTTST